MDGNSKANFINAVGSGQGIPCPSCNTLNEAGALFCYACGCKLENKPAEAPKPAFAPAEPAPAEAPAAEAPKPAFAPAEPAPAAPVAEAAPTEAPKPAFAPAEPAPAEEPAAEAPKPAFAPSEPAPAAPVAEPAPAEAPAAEAPKPAFAPAGSAPAAPAAKKENNSAKEVVPTFEVEEIVEEKSVFAEGLPEWDIVPPQIMVRRKKSK